MKSFEFITAISESSYSIHIEGVLPLTDGGNSLLQLGDVCLFIGLLTIVWFKKKNKDRTNFSPDNPLFWLLIVKVYYKEPKRKEEPARRFFSCLACSSLVSVWKARGGPLGNSGGNFSDSSCCWMRWNSLRLAGTAERDSERQRFRFFP